VYRTSACVCITLRGGGREKTERRDRTRDWFLSSCPVLTSAHSCFIVVVSQLVLSFQTPLLQPRFAGHLSVPHSCHIYPIDLPFELGLIICHLPPSPPPILVSNVWRVTRCLWSSYPPTSCTPFSHHQCIRCRRQHHQLQYLCHWRHRRITMSVSVPPSPHDATFYPYRRPLPVTEHLYYHGPPSRLFQRSAFSRMEHIYRRRTGQQPWE
jgi:hypothetical protein